MSEQIDYHAIVSRLHTLNAWLEDYLISRKAKGYMQVAETGELRDALFKLHADYQKVRFSLESQLNHLQLVGLQEAMQAVSAAAICLLSGRHDSPYYVSVDARRLEKCVVLMKQRTGVVPNDTEDKMEN